MNTSTTTVSSFDQHDHLAVVDALRGYAILLVIAVHSIGYVNELVWPAKRVLTFGFYGVQLFFMASAMTLLMSWHRSHDPFGKRALKFLIRRFFRIAPLYYLAIPFYWFAYSVNSSEFSLELLFATMFFYNAWSPHLIPTVPGWTPVPGGWSISVEFCFYFVFPILASSVTSLKRALVLFFIAFAIMLVASTGGAQLYPHLSIEERSNFLYFWPPNQLVVFSLGFLLYHLVKNVSVRQWLLRSELSSNSASIAICLLLFAMSFGGLRKFFDWTSFLPPTHLLASLLFLPWAVVLVTKPHTLVVNFMIVSLGKVSFSAYVLHFAVLKLTSELVKHVWPLSMEGIYSIPYYLILLVVACVTTWCIAMVTHRYVEQTFINVGKSIIQNLFPNPSKGISFERPTVES